MSKFVLHPEAYADLKEIWGYIATDNPDAADRTLDEIYGPPSLGSTQLDLVVPRRQVRACE